MMDACLSNVHVDRGRGEGGSVKSPHKSTRGEGGSKKAKNLST